MKRALITGITGFTGNYVAAELSRHGWEVWGTGSHDRPGDARYRRANILDIESLRAVLEEVRPHAVVHLAGIAYVGHGDSEDFYRVNLIGTRNLLKALIKCGENIETVLLVSSANVYGNTTEGILSEKTPLSPTNDYAVSKLAMEYMSKLWQEELPIIITRPFNYTGIGQSEAFLLPKVVSHFRRRAEVIKLGNLDVWRDFSDVRAVAMAYRRILEVRPIGETVNVCSGQCHSLREILELARNITGHKIKVDINPDLIRTNEVKVLCGNPDKLVGIIGEWQSPPLHETLSWMLE